MKVKPVNEANTSKTCSLCGEIHEDGRIKRGLFECPHTEKVINADLNGAINMMKHNPKSDEDRGKWLTEGTACGLSLDEQSGVGNH